MPFHCFTSSTSQALLHQHTESVTWLKGLQAKCSLVMRLCLYAYLNLTILCRCVEVHVARKLLLLLGPLVVVCSILQPQDALAMQITLLVICVC